MKIAALKENYQLRVNDYRGQQQFRKELYEVLYECLDLYNRGFVNFSGEVAFGPTDVNPGRMNLQAMGVDIFNLMGLATIPSSDLEPIVAQLR